MSKAIIWSKTTCPYCDLAKELFTDIGVDYEERVIGADWSKADLLAVVPDAKTVPQIFIDDAHIGGYDDLRAHLENQ